MLTWENFVEYYLSLRPQIFTGFLTVGSFLLSMKTFIVTTMKKEYYQKTAYRPVYLKNRRFDKELMPYDPLLDLGRLLTSSIIASYITAFSQITLGYFIAGPERGAASFNANYTSVTLASFNFLMALFSFYLVVRCIFVIHANVRDLLESESKELKEDIEKEEKEKKDKEAAAKTIQNGDGCCC